MKTIQEKIALKEKLDLKLIVNLSIKLIVISMLAFAACAFHLKAAHWELLLTLCLVVYSIDQMVERFCRQLKNYASYRSLHTAKADLRFKTVTRILTSKLVLSIYFLMESFCYPSGMLTLHLGLMCCALGLIISSLYIRTSSISNNLINFTT